jgi:hypothetical protein
MPTVTVGLMAPGNSQNYSVTFFPVIGNVGMSPGADTSITWTMAGTSGVITAPAGASIAGISIGQGAATFDWAGGTPQNNNGVWSVPNNVPNPAAAFTFGYVVTVSYNGTPYVSSDPEIVNEPPAGATFGGDPDIVRSAPGD